MEKGIAYYRVSTDRQGESGLGLEAQKEAVRQFVKFKNIKLVKEVTEIESGKKNKRPVLKEALQYCAKNKAILLIAKLDRLGRNVAFISTLMESHVKFIAVDNPEATHLVLHIMAAFAQHERELISSRTKDALQAAKKRGVRLGANGKVIGERNRRLSEELAGSYVPLITDLKRKGFKTIQALTDELNRRGTPTFRAGSRWHKSTVHTLLKTQEKVVFAGSCRR